MQDIFTRTHYWERVVSLTPPSLLSPGKGPLVGGWAPESVRTNGRTQRINFIPMGCILLRGVHVNDVNKICFYLHSQQLRVQVKTYIVYIIYNV
jgi:hypothetical protein